MLNLLSVCCVSSGKEQKSKDNQACLKRAHGLSGEMVTRALKKSADVITATQGRASRRDAHQRGTRMLLIKEREFFFSF